MFAELRYTGVMHVNHWQRGILVEVLVLVSFWLLSLIWGLIGKTHIAVSQANDAKREYVALESRKAQLEASLAVLATARGRDAAIRTDFGVARPGEEVIVVVPSATTTPEPAVSWWQKFLSWF